MTLGELIDELEKYPAAQRVRTGFGHPHSYRGFYDELAFEPVSDTTIGAILAAAHEADGSTYEGWKGGDYIMRRHSEVHLAVEGSTGDEITSWMLQAMLRPTVDPALENLHGKVVQTAMAYAFGDGVSPLEELQDALMLACTQLKDYEP